MPNGVTHKELNEALDHNTERLLFSMLRMEDSIKDSVKDVKSDCKEDVEKLSGRVDVLEGDAKKQTIIATLISSATAIVLSISAYVIGGK
jgi:hypothetical protein